MKWCRTSGVSSSARPQSSSVSCSCCAAAPVGGASAEEVPASPLVHAPACQPAASSAEKMELLLSWDQTQVAATADTEPPNRSGLSLQAAQGLASGQRQLLRWGRGHCAARKP